MAAEQDRTDFDDNVDLPDEHSDELAEPETDLEAEAAEVDGDDAADLDASESEPAEAAASDDEAAADADDDETAAAAEPTETPEEAAQREAEERLLELFQSTVYGTDGQKIGRVGQVYLDDQTQEPNWVTVKTGFFGIKEYFVPLDLAERDGKRVTVPYTKDQVTSAPRTEIDQNLSPAEEDDLYAHYQVPGKLPEPDPLLVESADDADLVADADAEAGTTETKLAEAGSESDGPEIDDALAADTAAVTSADEPEQAVADEAFAPTAAEIDEDAADYAIDAEPAAGDALDEAEDAELDAAALDLEADPEIEKPDNN